MIVFLANDVEVIVINYLYYFVKRQMLFINVDEVYISPYGKSYLDVYWEVK